MRLYSPSDNDPDSHKNEGWIKSLWHTLTNHPAHQKDAGKEGSTTGEGSDAKKDSSETSKSNDDKKKDSGSGSGSGSGSA